MAPTRRAPVIVKPPPGPTGAVSRPEWHPATPPASAATKHPGRRRPTRRPPPPAFPPPGFELHPVRKTIVHSCGGTSFCIGSVLAGDRAAAPSLPLPPGRTTDRHRHRRRRRAAGARRREQVLRAGGGRRRRAALGRRDRAVPRGGQRMGGGRARAAVAGAGAGGGEGGARAPAIAAARVARAGGPSMAGGATASPASRTRTVPTRWTRGASCARR